MVMEQSSAEHIRQLLTEPQIQEELAALFAYYYDEVHVISDVAASECQGIRPKGLENEVYACLHHIARGLALMDCHHALEEISKGKKSHLKRLHLDAYKIAINSFLKEYDELVSSLRFFVLEDTFKRIDPNGSEKALAISDKAGFIKQNYLEARKLESAGKHEEAADLFLEALTACYDLRQMIHELTKDNLYQIAVAYMAKQQRDKEESEKRSRRWDIVKIVLTAIVSAVISGLVVGPLSARLTSKKLSEKQDNARIESVEHGTPTTRQK